MRDESRAVLEQEYRILRDDEREWASRMAAIGSVYVLVAGTSTFFLLRTCAVSDSSSCTSYPWWVFALLPAPTFAVLALIVQHAVTATVRGRILLAVEQQLASDASATVTLQGEEVPVPSSFHAQLPWIHGRYGSVLFGAIYFSALVPFVAVIIVSGFGFSGFLRHLGYIGVWGAVGAALVWAGASTIGGFATEAFEKLETKIAAAALLATSLPTTPGAEKPDSEPAEDV